jgi:hypothetical protein
MPNPQGLSVDEAVYTVLENLGVPPSAARGGEVPLLQLLLDDDLTFEFVPDIEEILNVRVPLDEWERVRTVDEVIAMLREHVKT